MTVIGRSAATALDVRLRTELWRRIEENLADGQTLVTESQFCLAIESAYHDVTGEMPPAQVRRQLRRLVHKVNLARPKMFLARGVANAVNKALAHGIEHLRWDDDYVQRRGSASIHRFLQRERVEGLLQEIEFDSTLLDVDACVRDGAALARARKATGQRDLASVSQTIRLASGRSAPGRLPQASDSITEEDAQDLEIVLDGLVRPDEIRRRTQQQQQLSRQLHASALERLPRTVSMYVDDGLVSADQARQLRALAEIDTALEAGDINQAEAARQQLGIIDDGDRRVLDAVVRKAVAGTMSHLRVFGALQKIRGDYDGLLRTLIQHKDLVLGGDEGDRTPLMSALMRAPGFLDLAASAMERKDPELRLLSARLPPYDLMAPRTSDSVIPRLPIEVSFVDDLRRLSLEEFSERLESKDRAERNRATEDLYGLIRLLDQLIEPTPFRRKVRLVLANRILQSCGDDVEAICRATEISVARDKVNDLLTLKLERVLANASPEEELAIRRRSQAVLMAMEQKQAADDDTGGIGPVDEAEQPQAAIELAHFEKARGAQIVRVEIRVAGRPQTTEAIVMPSPEDSKRHVLVERDPESGELTPQMRRGRLRYAQRQTNGSWKALTG